MKKRNTTLNISQENFEKYPPAIFLKCTCNVSKLIAMGGGGWKQYYLVREADPSVVFYLHFGGGGRQSLLWDPRPPPHLALPVQNMVNEGNVVFIVLRSS